ncbi:MAG: sigma 54-interacting transcriptional regulator [Myxococcaceae bacterium]|nr:sigma 54-interacting transcriptional regulator [Myxococcaceae bacterium]
MASSQLETVRLQDKAEPSTRGRRYRLVVVNEAGSSSHALPATGQVVLGRGDDATLRLDDAAASRRHAVLHLGPVVRLEDLGSANGTTVRGRKLNAGESVDVLPGDSIELGTSLAVLQTDELSGSTTPWTLVTHTRFVETLRSTKPPFGVLRLQVQATPGVAQAVLSAELSPHDTVASFGPGQFEVLSPGRNSEAATKLMEKLSTKLVAAGARVRAGAASAPVDGADPELLLAACATPSGQPAQGFLVRDDAMVSISRLIDRVAPSQINVLLLGETGSGKEVLAGEIHRRSKRGGGPFLKLNCAALTESLLESELFGHEKGSFTGAVKQKLGLLETAKAGSVFLDEVGELPESLQAKLLRVLEERKVMRVGATAPEPIDVRFIFATNRDLEAEVERGAFRRDLYYRINGISISIPPLRERVGEIEPLARQFLAEAATREGRSVPELTAEALAQLKTWPWPGNIRELKNVMERALLLAGDAPITPDAIAIDGHEAPAPGAATGNNLKDERDAAEKRVVLEALEKTGGNQTKAAELLGISRRTLVNRLTAYGMTKPRKKQER